MKGHLNKFLNYFTIDHCTFKRGRSHSCILFHSCRMERKKTGQFSRLWPSTADPFGSVPASRLPQLLHVFAVALPCIFFPPPPGRFLFCQGVGSLPPLYLTMCTMIRTQHSKTIIAHKLCPCLKNEAETVESVSLQNGNLLHVSHECLQGNI